MYLRIAIFEDNNKLRDMLYQLINGTPGFSCVGSFANANDLEFAIESTKPQVVVMDIEMPGRSGIEATRIIKEMNPQIQILMQTIFEDDEKIFESICAGASGYILKNTPPVRILEAIQEVSEGGSPMSPSIARKMLNLFQRQNKPDNQEYDLSEREKEVLGCLVKGMSYKMIADACYISLDTVKFHLKNIYTKLHVNSKSEAVIKAIRSKIV
ncbi:MAG TPA: response regulator transcription factor [Chitinophagales bacterium]|nr:response regulator transcription factor [Chitinophagales bacterium]